MDLEGVPRFPWNPPFKDKLVPKNLSDLIHPTRKAEKHACLNCRHNLGLGLGQGRKACMFELQAQLTYFVRLIVVLVLTSFLAIFALVACTCYQF